MQKAAISSKTATSGSFLKAWTLVLQACQEKLFIQPGAFAGLQGRPSSQSR